MLYMLGSHHVNRGKIQSMTSHPMSWRSILILSSHLHLGLPNVFFPSSFPTSTLPHTCYMPRPLRPRFDHLNILREDHRSLSSSLCSFLHSPVTLSFLGPSILLSTLFSNTLNLRSSPKVSDQVLHPYKTRDKIIVLYILIFKFLDSKLEDKRFCTI